MPTNDYVLDFQVFDSELDHGEGVEVRWREDVRDVSVDEDIAGLQAEDGCFRASRVRATNPKDLRVLTFGEGREQIRFGPSYCRGPSLVGGERTDVCVCEDAKTLSAWCCGFAKQLERGLPLAVWSSANSRASPRYERT